MEKIRILKYFSDCGVLSRRAAEAEIAAGHVTVNGRPVSLGDKVDPSSDVVAWKGERIRTPERSRERKYIMLYKPARIRLHPCRRKRTQTGDGPCV